MSDPQGFVIPEVGGALRHLSERPTAAAAVATGAAAGAAAGAATGAAADAEQAARLAAAAERLIAGVHRSARSALCDRLAALLAEVAARCRPPVELLPEDVGPEHRRLPSDLVSEARRLSARLGLALPEDVLQPPPEDPATCRARVERLLAVLSSLEGDSVRVTDARLRMVRAGR